MVIATLLLATSVFAVLTPAHAYTEDTYLVVADSGNGEVTLIEPDGVGQFTPVSGMPTPSYGATVAPDGTFYVSSDGTDQVIKIDPDNTQTVLPFVGLSVPVELELDIDGNLYVADGLNGRILKMAPDQTITTVVTFPSFTYGIALDDVGNLYVSLNSLNQVVKVAPDNTQTVLPFVGLNGPEGLDVDDDGNVYVASFVANTITKLAPDNTQTVLPFVGLNGPTGVAADEYGNIYAASFSGNSVFKLAPDNTQTTIGSGFSGPWQLMAIEGVSLEGTPPDGTVGDEYNFAFTVGGYADATVTLQGGTLPPGLTLSSSGLLEGIPTTPGTYTFTIRADAFTSEAELEAQIIIHPKPTPTPPAPAPEPPAPPAPHHGGLARTGVEFDAATGVFAALVILLGAAALTASRPFRRKNSTN